ncbi:MAG TPA: glycosyltransferase family 2 protein [Anaerolineales bacterium]|nr:glycosyltransferase family 2 protein [Anaerolineales bacterium]
MSKLKFSIVTPSFNQAAYIEATIQSVLEQDYQHVEYIIIDGASLDGSVDVIKKYEKKLAAWISEEDNGQTDALNKGFHLATGDIFAWINSDDTYEPGTFKAVAEFFERNPEIGMVYGDAHFIDDEGKRIGKFPAAQTDYARLRAGYVHIPQQAAFFRAEVWKKVGPLDPDFYFAMDYDLWIRIAKIAKIVYLPGKFWANFRLHTQAKTISADDRCWPEMLKVHYRDGGSFFSPIVFKYYLRKLLAPIITWNRARRLK